MVQIQKKPLPVLDLGSPHKVADRLDDDEKGRTSIPTLGGIQQVTIVNEPGLYSVILRSEKAVGLRGGYGLPGGQEEGGQAQ